MNNYNELRDGQEFFANGYKKGYEDAKKEFARPTGTWEFEREWYGDYYYRCDNCNNEERVPTCMTKPTYRFCPNCGAKMKIEDSETASRDPRQGREVR